MRQTSTLRPARRFTGLVVSEAMPKTIVVRVDRMIVHPKYGKRHAVSRRYPVHDERDQYRVGDRVTFVECRPLSKTKRWRVLYEGAAGLNR